MLKWIQNRQTVCLQVLMPSLSKAITVSLTVRPSDINARILSLVYSVRRGIFRHCLCDYEPTDNYSYVIMCINCTCYAWLAGRRRMHRVRVQWAWDQEQVYAQRTNRRTYGVQKPYEKRMYLYELLHFFPLLPYQLSGWNCLLH